MRNERSEVKAKSIMRKIAQYCFICISLSTFNFQLSTLSAQADYGVPGFDTIAGNPAEYRKIIDKFALGQERLTRRECVIAYYGYAFQVYYSTDPTDHELKMQEYILRGDLEKVYDMGNMVLSRNPVNLTALYWTLAAATETKKSWEVMNSLKTRYNNVTVAIAGSGDGLSPETAFRVVQIGDMYVYCMVELEVEPGDAYLLDGRYTAFPVTPSPKFRQDEVYFDCYLPLLRRGGGVPTDGVVCHPERGGSNEVAKSRMLLSGDEGTTL